MWGGSTADRVSLSAAWGDSLAPPSSTHPLPRLFIPAFSLAVFFDDVGIRLVRCQKHMKSSADPVRCGRDVVVVKYGVVLAMSSCCKGVSASPFFTVYNI